MHTNETTKLTEGRRFTFLIRVYSRPLAVSNQTAVGQKELWGTRTTQPMKTMNAPDSRAFPRSRAFP